MKIYFVSVFYLPQAVGGIELYIHHLAKGLLAKGYDVKIVVPAYENYDINMNDYEYDGVQVIRYKGYGAEGNKLQTIGIAPNEGLQNFKSLLANEKPDVVHFSQITNSSGVSLSHILAAKHSGAKVVYTNHLTEFICRRGDLKYKGMQDCTGSITADKCTTCMLHKKGISKVGISTLVLADKLATAMVGNENYKALSRWVTFPGFASRWHIHKITSIVKMSDAFVSIAGWNSERMQQNNWFKPNCVTIKTGLFNNTASPVCDMEYDGRQPLKIIYLGRIVPVKGLEVLVKAVTKIKKEAIELHIYGPKGHGHYVTYIDDCGRLANGFENVFFHPPVANTEVVNLLSQHHLLCLPSTVVEMAPLVIQEAMAAKVPVLGSAQPAIQEWITDGFNGFTFATGDAQALTEKLNEIISTPSLLQKAKNNIQPPVSFSSVIDKYDALYQSLFMKNESHFA